MACSSSLKQIITRNERLEILQMEWSSKMDLVAIVNEKSEIRVNRLKWQCIWPQPFLKESLVVRGLAWRPDEKVIALGYENGLIVLFDVESKEELHTFIIDEAIVSLSWTRNTKECHLPDDEEDNCMIELPPLNLSTGKPTAALNIAHSNSILNFLVIATKEASVLLYAFGTLFCGKVNCRNFLPEDEKNSRNLKILSAHLGPGFDKLFVQVLVDNRLRTLILENQFLSKNYKSMLDLSRRHCEILDTMIYINDVIQNIKEAWESVLLEMDTKLTKYAETVTPGSVSADFIVLLVFGKASPELEHFLVHDLTERGLKKLGNCVELSYTTIQKLVIHPLQTGILHVWNHLNSLRGLSRNQYKYGSLLKESVIEKALQRGGSFLIKAFELQQTIEQSTRDYKIFFRWLYSVIMAQIDENVPDDIGQMTQQDLNYLSQFLATLDDDEDGVADQFKKEDQLQRKFNLEKVGQYLEDKCLPVEAYPLTDWQKMLAKNACIRESPLIFQHEPKASLIQQYKALQESIGVIFEEQQVMISKSFKCTFSVHQDVNETLEIGIRCWNGQKNEGGAFNYFIYLLHSKSFLFLSDNDHLNRFRRFQFNNMPFYYNEQFAGGEFTFLDLQFYNEETVSVLLKCVIPEQESRIYFLQMPLSSLMTERSNFYEVMDPNALKLVEGGDWRYLAVSGNRKVCSILNEARKRVRLYETEVDSDEEDDDIDNSNLDGSQ